MKWNQFWEIYVIETIDENYYVGLAKNSAERIKKHFDGNGCEFTKKHKPLECIIIINSKTQLWWKGRALENIITLLLAKKYGFERVAGGRYCNEQIRKKYKNEVDDQIKKVYKGIENYKKELRKIWETIKSEKYM